MTREPKQEKENVEWIAERTPAQSRDRDSQERDVRAQKEGEKRDTERDREIELSKDWAFSSHLFCAFLSIACIAFSLFLSLFFVLSFFSLVQTTNGFLINSHDPRALLYNDIRVLENTRVAAAYQFLQTPGVDIFHSLSRKDRHTVRHQIISSTFAANTTNHFQFLSK